MLLEPDSAVFAWLRILRKQVADAEDVSSDAVFNYEHLVAMTCFRAEAARTAGWASDADCQRAWDGSLATLSGCDSGGFRRRVLAGFGYSLEPGCPSN